ncbi:anthrone oxygenase family protein [Williamsia sp. M5A3_1d]
MATTARVTDAFLVLGVTTSGLVAGLFCAFAYAVMPGLHRTDDRTLVTAMQKINVAIVNPVFLLLFFGGLVVAVAAAWCSRSQPIGPWAIAAAVLYLVGMVVTIAANIPLNDRLAASLGLDADGAREVFETAWVRWNSVRAVAHTAGFVVLATGLVIGRA